MAERVEAARACWNAGDLPGYLMLYDASIRLHGYGPEPFDKAAVVGFYEAIWAALAADGRPNPELEFFETVEEDDRYACRFVMRGVHCGPFLGVAATGRPYALGGITLMRFGVSGTVVERFSCADMLGLMIQLGALPPPG
jgi:predicted ester cyclase